MSWRSFIVLLALPLTTGLLSCSAGQVEKQVAPTVTALALTPDTAFKDTVINQHVLVGTTALPGTEQSSAAYWLHGIALNRVSFSPCSDGETEDMGSTEVGKIQGTDSTLVIDAKVISNCGFSFLCDIQVVNDTILDLMFYGYGFNADCVCCFGLTYHIRRFNDLDEAIAPTCVMIGGDRRTLKKLSA